MKTRNTKQKQMIADTLAMDKSHPTIQGLFENIQEKYQDIGQATIYRNVAKMVEEGKIKKIPTLNGVDRYDGDTSEHCHLICHQCGMLVDIFDSNIGEVVSLLERNNQIEITNHSILLEGLCPTCKKNVE